MNKLGGGISLAGSAIGSTTAGHVTPRHISQVEDQFNGLDDAICQLQTLVGAIEEKTAAVTRHSEPGVENGTPEGVLVPVADTIRSMKNRILITNYRLQSLLDRIEL